MAVFVWGICISGAGWWSHSCLCSEYPEGHVHVCTMCKKEKA